MSTAGFGPAPSLAADRQPYTSAWVYLLRCADGSLYAGWTNDLARRLRAHRGQGVPNTPKATARPLCSWPTPKPVPTNPQL